MPYRRNLSASFVLHDWLIKISTDDPNLIPAIRLCLPHYFRARKKSGSLKRKTIQISLYRQPKKIQQPPVDPEGKKQFYYPADNVLRMIDFEKDEVSFFVGRNLKLSTNWLFHAVLLYPLSRLIRKYQAFMVHAALLEKNGSGILIMGNSGTGKSTFSAIGVQNGFRYYSDEHPLVALKDNKVVGKSFYNLIGLKPVSRKNFLDLAPKMTWSRERNKYYLDPESIHGGCLGDVCEIKKVIFPAFTPHGGKIRVKELKKKEFLKALFRDEYFNFNIGNEMSEKLSLSSFYFSARMAGSAKGFTLDYGTACIRQLPSVLEKL